MLNGIRAILTDDATLTGLVGTKVYAVRAEQRQDPPLIVLIAAGADPNNCKTGNSSIADEVDVTVIVMALTYAETLQIAERVRVLLDDYNGLADGEDLNIDFVTYQDAHDDRASLYVRNMTFNVFHKA